MLLFYNNYFINVNNKNKINFIVFIILNKNKINDLTVIFHFNILINKQWFHNP